MKIPEGRSSYGDVIEEMAMKESRRDEGQFVERSGDSESIKIADLGDAKAETKQFGPIPVHMDGMAQWGYW